ncbi:MAG: hypothetical protein R3Y57_03525 [Erysipelotrichaceae bacterium]
MKQGIQLYGLLWVFTFCVIILVSFSGLSVIYRQCSELSALVVEVIEVHTGLNEESEEEIEDIKNEYDLFTIQIDSADEGSYQYYHVSISKTFKLPLLNLSYPITSTRRTRRIYD